MKRVIFFFTLFITIRPDAAACLCSQLNLREISQWVEQQNRIFFLGTVVKIKELKIQNRNGKHDLLVARLVTFRIDKGWKKSGHTFIKISTGGGQGDCGLGFVKSEQYLVDATKENSFYETDTCTATRKIADAKELILALNKWQKDQKSK